ncbi:MAG TPA: hypothetical protein VFS10_09060 [Pyrinomonadaceae bacterium]|nr:hypothetical protein [Pyrinomonadaceae bacterium]
MTRRDAVVKEVASSLMQLFAIIMVMVALAVSTTALSFMFG